MRWLIAFPLSLCCAFGLFAFIAWMVGGSPKMEQAQQSRLKFDLVMQEPESDVARKQRSLPEPPKPPIAPAQSLPSQAKAESSLNPIDAPQLTALDVQIDTSVTGFALQAPTLSQANQLDQQAMPLSRVPPQYPIRALKRNLEGYVVMEFTIDGDGRPKDIAVIDAKPKNIFEREARRALQRWKYQPKRIDGKGVDQPNQRVTIQFNLEQHES